MQLTRKTIGTALGLFAPLFALALIALWFRQNNLVGIPEDRSLWVVLFSSAIVMGIASFVLGTRWFGGIGAVFGVILGLFIPLTMTISKQEVAESAIKVGDTIPYFAALDDQGERFTSDALAGTPVLIKFFRAHW